MAENSLNILPRLAIPGAEIEILTGSGSGAVTRPECLIGGNPARVIAASSKRVLAEVPDDVSGRAEVQVEGQTGAGSLLIGNRIADAMHIVANPAVDPADGSVVLTRSGSRGIQLPNTIYRIETDGYIDELPVEVMNPTGIAFSPRGEMFVSNRAAGEVYTIERGEEAIPYVTGLGIATGIAFDSEGTLYVGDRSGSLYRVPAVGRAEKFAELEPSVAAYHIAFGPDGRLYVTAPGLASYDAVYAVDMEGGVETYVRGFGRPQGLAFDIGGNLYLAACYRGRHGVVRISPELEIEQFVAGNSIVGLCFTAKGELVVATGDSAFTFDAGINGTLLRSQ